MRRTLAIALLAATTLVATRAQNVTFKFSDGIYNESLKTSIERNISLLLTNINKAARQKSSHVDTSGITITDQALNSFNDLWEFMPFSCDDDFNVERCVQTVTGYQVRGIPLIVNSAQGGDELGYQEAVVNFDKRGVITSFYYTINPELYSQLRMDQMSNPKYEVSDIKDRMMILDYVEHFRTSYNQKDLKFLRQVFSDDAIIITGTVIKVRKSEVVPSGKKVKYTVQTKQQYLDNLARAFKSNSYIKVSFDNVVIVEHPTIKDIYGVTVHQKWNTARYSDEGYVFMVWDFRNPDTPQIHVRTWQPDYIDKERGQRLNPNDVFTLGDFDL